MSSVEHSLRRQIPIIFGMDCPMPSTPTPILQALMHSPRVKDNVAGILAGHTYVCPRDKVAMELLDLSSNPDLPQAPSLSSSVEQPVEMQASFQVSCTLAESSPLFNLHGMNMEHIRSSDTSPRPDQFSRYTRA